MFEKDRLSACINTNIRFTTFKNLNMDIQTKKMQFIEEYLRITDEGLLNKLLELLRKERQKSLQAALQPMTQDELSDKLQRSEQDIETERIYTQQEVEAYMKSRRGA